MPLAGWGSTITKGGYIEWKLTLQRLTKHSLHTLCSELVEFHSPVSPLRRFQDGN